MKVIEITGKINKKLSEKIKLFIAIFGPIGIGYNCDNTLYTTTKFYGTQVYSYQDTKKDILKWYKGEISDEEFNNKYDNKSSNHAVEIIGWTPPNDKTGRECWIVKNSFGELWGDDGFLLIPIGINAFKSENHPDILIQTEFLTKKYKNILNILDNILDDKNTIVKTG